MHILTLRVTLRKTAFPADSPLRSPQMASFETLPSGRIRAQVYVHGKRASKSFRTRREANSWAAAKETEFHAAEALPEDRRHTLSDVLRRYLEDVVPWKRGRKYETVRINAWLRGEMDFPGDVALADLTSDLIGKWRDRRLTVVQSSTVLRELKVLSAAMNIAVREWGWCKSSPVTNVRRPTAPDHREVVISPMQVRAMLRSLGVSSSGPAREVRHAVGICFLLALRTGMRAGELCGLAWSRVFGDHALLPVTKTKPRSVPLSRKAIRTIERMRGWDDELVFGLKPSTLDAMFRKYRERAGLSGFTFHDSRHTAATMLSRHLDVLDLCKMFGWSNPKQALVYYNPTAAQIAARIDRRK